MNSSEDEFLATTRFPGDPIPRFVIPISRFLDFPIIRFWNVPVE
jgi:hypothetical protein